jgi:hypothetical protein
MKSIRVRSKVWLAVDGEPFLGNGGRIFSMENTLI